MRSSNGRAQKTSRLQFRPIGAARDQRPLSRSRTDDIEFYMKRMLIELDDRCARDLERVAPAKRRQRAEFVRLAIRHAVDVALDRATAEAYASRPVESGLTATDLAGWDEHNVLARAPRRPSRKSTSGRAA